MNLIERLLLTFLIASTALCADGGDYVTIADGQIRITTAEMNDLQSGKELEPLTNARLAHLSYRPTEGTLFLDRAAWRKTAVPASRNTKDTVAWKIMVTSLLEILQSLRPNPLFTENLIPQQADGIFLSIDPKAPSAWYLFPDNARDGSKSVALYWMGKGGEKKDPPSPADIYRSHYFITELEVTVTEATPNGPVRLAEPTKGIYLVTHRQVPKKSGRIITGDKELFLNTQVALSGGKLSVSIPVHRFLESIVLPVIQDTDKSIEALVLDGEFSQPPEKAKDPKKDKNGVPEKGKIAFVLDPAKPEATNVSFFVHDKANRDVVFRCDIGFKEAQF